MIVILLKAALVLSVLLAFYKLFLAKESFYQINRIYLIACIGFAFLIPFISLPQFIENQGIVEEFIDSHSNTSTSRAELAIHTDNKSVIDNSFALQSADLKLMTDHLIIEKNLASEIITTPLDNKHTDDKQAQGSKTTTKLISNQKRTASQWLILFYLFGVIVLSINLIIQVIITFYKGINSSDRIKDEASIIINISGKTEPCSFFNYIFINPSLYDYETYEQIIKHEKIHVNKGHSIDFVLSELAIILLWFNPFVWIFRREVEKNIEYQTDALLVKSNPDIREKYQLNLLKIATYTKPLAITTNYNQSLIKQRILKMNSKKSTLYSYWKYAFVLPMMFGIIILLNKPTIVNAQSETSSITAELFTNPRQESHASRVFETQNQHKQNDIPESKKVYPVTALNDEQLSEKENLNKSKNIISIESESEIKNRNLHVDGIELDEVINASISNACTSLKNATEKGDIGEISELLKYGDLGCLIQNNDQSSSKLRLLQGLLFNGARLDVSTAEGTIRVHDTREHIRWGTVSSQSKDKICQELKITAKAGQLSKIKQLILNLEPGCLKEEDGSINNLVYIKDLIRNGSKISIHDNGEIILDGVEVIINFSKQEQFEIKSYKNFNSLEDIESGLANLSKAANNSSDCKSLISAVILNDIAKVRQLLKQTDANCIDENPDRVRIISHGNEYFTSNPRTALVAAAHFGYIEITKILLENGAKIDFYAQGDGTALMTAASNGHLAVVKYLHNKGASLNKEVRGEGTALNRASRNGHLEIVKYLVKNDANINAIIQGDGSALIGAAQNGHLKTLQFLIENGANVNEKVQGEGTALSAASRGGHMEAIDILLQNHAEIDAQVSGEGTALIAAVRSENIPIIEYLIIKGANVNTISSGEGNPLTVAVSTRNHKTMNLLLAKGANVNASISGEGTALSVAARNGDVESVEFLLTKGADINGRAAGEGTALSVASRKGYLELVNFLIDKNADVNTYAAGEGTPLVCAARNGHYEIAKSLLDNGADPNIIPAGDDEAMHYARKRMDNNMIDLLKKYGDKN